jgi:uncharacterized RDD family membrane protein YckC
LNFLPLRVNETSVYAGFWKRLAAAIIDMIIIIPLLYLFIASRHYSYALAMINTLLIGGLFVVYCIFFNARFGGSVGKLVVGIKVTRPDGSRIGWGEACMRSSVDIFFGILFIYVYLIPLLHIDSRQYSAAAINERYNFLSPYQPSWYRIADILKQVWFWSELIVLLFNKRKRSLHDFIAGTVVIDEKFAEPVVPPDRQETVPASR